jgi:uncharacterized membrane protein YedE/YeeE
MLSYLQQPWAWYVGGALIGLIVPTLLIIGNKSFGISSSLRHICAATVPANIKFFKYDWKKEQWNLFFIAGIFLGGLIASTLLANPEPIQIAESTKTALATYGITDFQNLIPTDIFSLSKLGDLRSLVLMIGGGFLVGFGTRYAGGCTSGHAIMGLSTLQLPSLVAVLAFMAGGFLMTWFILPFILTF